MKLGKTYLRDAESVRVSFESLRPTVHHIHDSEKDDRDEGGHDAPSQCDVGLVLLRKHNRGVSICP